MIITFQIDGQDYRIQQMQEEGHPRWWLSTDLRMCQSEYPSVRAEFLGSLYGAGVSIPTLPDGAPYFLDESGADGILPDSDSSVEFVQFRTAILPHHYGCQIWLYDKQGSGAWHSCSDVTEAALRAAKCWTDNWRAAFYYVRVNEQSIEARAAETRQREADLAVQVGALTGAVLTTKNLEG